MKKLLALIALAALSLAVVDKCSAQFSKLSIGKYTIESIKPKDFTTVQGVVSLEVANETDGFTVSDINGMVYKKGMPFVTGQVSDFHVTVGEQKLIISGHAILCESASLWNVLGLLFFEPEDYSVDIRMKVTMDSGTVRVIEKNGIPVEVLLKIR